ncbi:hypothetical protein D3C80_2226620 [compost metagenome]
MKYSRPSATIFFPAGTAKPKAMIASAASSQLCSMRHISPFIDMEKSLSLVIVVMA